MLSFRKDLGGRRACVHCAFLYHIAHTHGMPSPGVYPTVTVQLPLWPGLSGAAAVGPVLDPSAVPHAAASLGGGGGAALYAMPARDGVGARRTVQPSNRPTV